MTALRRPSLKILLPLIAALLIGAVIAIKAVSAGHEDAKVALAQATKFRGQNDLKAARVSAMNAVQADPDWVEARILRAEIDLELFRADDARVQLQRALDLGVAPEKINHLLGEALWLLGEYDQAEDLLSNTEFAPENKVRAQRLLGRLYMDRGDLPKAEAAFDGGLGSGGRKNSMLWTDIARYRLLTGNRKGAIEAADLAVRLDSNNVRALTFRGRMVRDQVGLVPALAWFERALAIRPDDVPALEEYAATLGEAGRYRDMLSTARKIISINSKSGKAYYFQAVIAARAGEYGLAQRILDMAGSAINDMPAAIMVSAVNEYQLGNINRSIDLLKKLVDRQPYNVRARRLLARIVLQSGDAYGALEYIRPLASRKDADAYSLKVAARAFEAEGDREKAAVGLDAAAWPVMLEKLPLDDPLSDGSIAEQARRNPNNARHVIPFIRLLMRQKRMGEALSNASRLRNNNPGVADAHLIEGDVLLAQNSMKRAEAAFNAAAAIKMTEPVMLRLVELYRRQGRFAEQRALISNFLSNNPTSLPALRLFGYFSIDDKKYAEAIPALEFVLWKSGYNDSILLANLARAQLGAGNANKASEYAAVAYKIDPANPLVTFIYGDALLTSGKQPKAAEELLEKVAGMMPDNKMVQEKYQQAIKARKTQSVR